VPEISVVVPARDAAATLPRTLAALAAQAGDVDVEVIVVDSGSRDGTVALAQASPVVSRVLHNPGGEPAGSRNVGVAGSSAPLIAFTDADCEPAPGWLVAGRRALAGAEIVQGMVAPGEATHAFDRTLSVTSEYGLYETASLFVRREAFDRVGGFQPVLGDGDVVRPFGEDTWFVWRARRTGARTAFAPDALVRHAVFPRGAGGFIAERARVRHFPGLVARVPELRGQFLHRRAFLSPVSLRFDLALGGLAVAGLAGLSGRRRSTTRSLAGLTAVPYLLPLAREARWLRGRDRWRVPAARVAADAVGFCALVGGSLRTRTVVL
jgi:glycosyltransferase involved in cell wall biosynthesis